MTTHTDPTPLPHRPLLRWVQSSDPLTRQYIRAIADAYNTLTQLLATLPTYTDITQDHAIPASERDVVWAIVNRTSQQLADERAALVDLWRASPNIRTVDRVPSEWTAAESAAFFRKPHLWHMTSEDTEDILTARSTR